MPYARSPKYPALYDPESGVRFSHGTAEVTEEQAFALAKRRFTDGILVDEVPAKRWAADQPGEPDEVDEQPESVPVEPVADAPTLPVEEAPKTSRNRRSE
jgi:hypothetical protein